LRFARRPLSHTVQWTVSRAASTGAKVDAAKTQSPNPNAQVKNEATNDEVLVPNVAANQGTMDGPVVRHSISQSPGLFRGAFVVTGTGAMTGTKTATLTGAMAGLLPGAGIEVNALAAIVARTGPVGPARVGPAVAH
jgi:hypothetical protein